MKNTANYGFNLPEASDFYDIEHINANFTGVDTKLKSLEDSTATKASQTVVDNIQTTSKAMLNTVGWYRVAEYVSTTSSVKGNQANSCILVIKRGYGNNISDYYKISLASVYEKQKFTVLESSNGSHLFTKIRYTYADKTAYLEVYYNGNSSNNCAFIVNNGNDYYFGWKAITPTLTSETVDGVTVTTTYDISANVSPVNNVDLVNGAFPMGAVGTERFIEYPVGGTFDSTTTVTGQLRITLPQLWGNTRIAFRVGVMTNSTGEYVEYIVSGYMGTSSGWSMYTAVCNSPNAYPVYFANDGSKCVVCIGELTTAWNRVKVQVFDVMVGHYAYTFDTWSKNWNIAITTDNSDLTIGATIENPYILKNYLNKTTGGEINGDITAKSTSATARKVGVENLNRRITLELIKNGTGYLWDGTNGKALATFKLNEDPVWNGTASGCLPLDGGGEVQKSGDIPFAIKNKTADSVTSLIGFTAGDGSTLALGLSGGKAVISGQGEILNTGNSAKVVISSTAPADTSALWVVPKS